MILTDNSNTEIKQKMRLKSQNVKKCEYADYTRNYGRKTNILFGADKLTNKRVSRYYVNMLIFNF